MRLEISSGLVCTMGGEMDEISAVQHVSHDCISYRWTSFPPP